MITAQMLSQLNAPNWRWTNPVTGDPLLRADDKGFTDLRGKPGALAHAVATIRNPRTRAEILARAERKYHDLERQLSDVRRRHLTVLESEAERELADQRTFVEQLAEVPT